MQFSKRKLAMIRLAARSSSVLAPKAAGKLMLHHFTRPINPQRPPREISWLESATRETDIPLRDGRKLAVWRWGNTGPVALLMHGWMGRGSQLAAFAQPLVDAGWQVIAFDAPAHGNSSGTHSSIGDFANALADIDAFFGGVDAIIAHSMGTAATTIACGRGLKPRKLVYIAAATNPARFFDFFAGHLGFSDKAAGHARLRMERLYGLDMSEIRSTDIAPKLDIPMLLLHDRGDKETTHDGAVSLIKAWPGSMLVSTDGLGHRRILRDDKVINDAVAFITAKPGQIAA